MPRRKERTRTKRLNDGMIEHLREAIAQGRPWLHSSEQFFGSMDLIGLIRGCWYPFCDVVDPEDDREIQAELWAALRDGIMAEHIRRRPGARPWGWWAFEAKEPRRVVATNGPAAVNNGKVYEGKLEYLQRLDLLTAGEKEIFKKFGDVVFVELGWGDYRNCATCWKDAGEIAREIGFDLKAAVLPDSVFWIPAGLFLDCDHMPIGAAPRGIFRQSYE